MNKRENLLWQIICLISVLAIGYIVYTEYNKQVNLSKEWDNSFVSLQAICPLVQLRNLNNKTQKIPESKHFNLTH